MGTKVFEDRGSSSKYSDHILKDKKKTFFSNWLHCFVRDLIKRSEKKIRNF